MIANILVIEDETALSNILKIKLEKENFKVTVAYNGAEGLESMLSKKPNLILLDMLMPVMNGTQLLTKMKGDKSLSDIPVIVLTNVADDEPVRELMRSGTYEYLIKSDVTIEEVIRRIKSRLSL